MVQYVGKDTITIFKSVPSRLEKAQILIITRRMHWYIKHIFNFFVSQFSCIPPFRIYKMLIT